jgi:hypothetical protein
MAYSAEISRDAKDQRRLCAVVDHASKRGGAAWPLSFAVSHRLRPGLLREALMTATPSTASHGFELLREQNLAEINSTARYYRHVKTGAELLSLVNSDENNGLAFDFPSRAPRRFQRPCGFCEKTNRPKCKHPEFPKECQWLDAWTMCC